MKWVILCICCFGFLSAGPKVVAKFGAPECPWSEQLKKDVWDSSTFQALLCSAGIEREVGEADGEAPVFALMMDDEEVGHVGFLLVPPEKYVDLLKEMMSIYTLTNSHTEMESVQLLHLYRKAQVLNMTACEEKLLQRGLQKDAGVDFLIEQYAKLVNDHPRRAQKIKQEIRARKPHDAGVEWSLALLSFQAKKTPLALEKFLKEYAADPDYAWRCHYVLAEYYQDCNLPEKARVHEECARDGAL